MNSSTERKAPKRKERKKRKVRSDIRQSSSQRQRDILPVSDSSFQNEDEPKNSKISNRERIPCVPQNCEENKIGTSGIRGGISMRFLSSTSPEFSDLSELRNSRGRYQSGQRGNRHRRSNSNDLRPGRPKRSPSEAVRQSRRLNMGQNRDSSLFKDISLKRFNNFVHLILNSGTTKMKNSLNSGTLIELCDALDFLQNDDETKIILFTGVGSIFCQGVDITDLAQANDYIRQSSGENLIRAMKRFLTTVISYPKLIVAGVNGTAIGLGVTMLPLFDMVIASDKAEFYLPYFQLEQVPEGGATYTFPDIFGKQVSNRLFLGKKISAQEAKNIGLITEIIWPSLFLETLLPKVAMLSLQPSQSIEATKALVNHYSKTKLLISIESECNSILNQWSSSKFLVLCNRLLDSGYFKFQTPLDYFYSL